MFYILHNNYLISYSVHVNVVKIQFVSKRKTVQYRNSDTIGVQLANTSNVGTIFLKYSMLYNNKK